MFIPKDAPVNTSCLVKASSCLITSNRPFASNPTATNTTPPTTLPKDKNDCITLPLATSVSLAKRRLEIIPSSNFFCASLTSDARSNGAIKAFVIALPVPASAPVTN